MRRILTPPSVLLNAGFAFEVEVMRGEQKRFPSQETSGTAYSSAT